MYSGNFESAGSDGSGRSQAHVHADARGRETNAITTTSDFTGAFNQAKTREEFMDLIRHNR